MTVWIQPESGVRVNYSFHPAMALRVLILTGEGAETAALELCDRLPILTINDIRQLLQSQDLESILLGLHAANVLEAYELLGLVAGLTTHADELVATEAQAILQQLLQKSMAVGLELLTEWKAQHPDQSVLFKLAGSAAEKRQVLRWLMHERTASNSAIEAALRTALEDSDWEVQATAMLAAGRLRAISLASKIRSLDLTNFLPVRIDKTTYQILSSCRKAVLALLEGVPIPPLALTPPDSRELMHHHILRCILGEPVHFQERTFLLIHALTTPLPDRCPLPEPLPQGIVQTSTGYSLAAYNLSLCWVPPIAHWLGDDLPKMAVSNPIRLHRPNQGFFISQQLFVPPDETVTNRGYSCTREEAIMWCDRLAAVTQLDIRLPTPDQWEMAIRGPDGRLFAWGNGLPDRATLMQSPWGVEELMVSAGEWTGEAISAREAIAVSAPKPLPCALRRLVTPNATLGFRLVIASHILE